MSQAMRWEKLGRLLRAEGQRPWMQTHTAMPMALALGGTRYRVYFATRDRDNRPHIGFVELDLRRPTEVVSICEDFVLGPGRPGCFDDNGIYPGPLVPDGRLEQGPLRRQRDVDLQCRVLAIAVNYGVDHRLAQRQPDVQRLVRIEAGILRHLLGRGVNEIDELHLAGQDELD